jgi:hypothetical protein
VSKVEPVTIDLPVQVLAQILAAREPKALPASLAIVGGFRRYDWLLTVRL